MILGATPHILKRYQRGENVDGRYVDGWHEELEIMLCVQPVSGRALSMLPEGFRGKEVLLGLTVADVRTVDGTDPPDVIIHGEKEYVGHNLFVTTAVIPHKTLWLVRRDPEVSS